MEDFDMDADDNIEQENDKSPQKKSLQPSGIAIEALTGLLDIYSSAETKVRLAYYINHLSIFFRIEFSSSSCINTFPTTTTNSFIISKVNINN
jgi:hypothetical protein